MLVAVGLVVLVLVAVAVMFYCVLKTDRSEVPVSTSKASYVTRRIVNRMSTMRKSMAMESMRVRSPSASASVSGEGSGRAGSEFSPTGRKSLNSLDVNEDDEASQASAMMNLAYPLKITVTFFQIATNVTSISTIPWPSYFRKFIASFVFFNIDFIPWQVMLRARCSLTMLPVQQPLSPRVPL